MISQALSALGFVGALSESPSPLVMKSLDGVKSVTFTLFTVFGARVRKLWMDKVTQSQVDAVADELFKEAGYDFARVVTNQVAVRLGKGKANSRIGDLVQNWKERRIAEGAGYVNAAPAELNKGLEVLYEGISRLTRGLAGKSLVESSQKHAQEIRLWSDQYEKQSKEIEALQAEFDEILRAKEQLEAANVELRSELTATRAELDQASVRLIDAKATIELLAKGQPVGEAATSGVNSSGPVGDAAHGGEVVSSAAPKRQRGGPRKDPVIPKRPRGRPKKDSVPGA